eukprot:TRINITY_DN736_c0_g4_i1.p2 TRINITY_DN736_c0_g4~~TRINITY_DN736_c0_g4_i1.p2  ORF type:complete len:195 (+),score=31.91 TRINITY_DN736_c0_g4_i1:294-878(+)
MTQQILKSMQSMIKMGGSVSLRSGVEKMLRSLCSWLLPADLHEEKDFKHVCVCKTTMEIIQEAHNLLGEKDWMHILQFIERITQALNKNKGEMVKRQMELMQFGALNKRVYERIEQYTSTKQINSKTFQEEEKLAIKDNQNLENKKIHSERGTMKHKENAKTEVRLELRDEIENIKACIDSLFVFTSTLDVSVR